ncbi:hypothetical protein CVT25_005903 [Psilocybe cyanescens]|uniref:allantoinase n=1 Tax=Psilocybe cyanescens TaxID=93625 RepID=A0A409VM27_PSICY|nr:hypothetical protein CVT25_005903 [Psilocybe cyanescens]
MSEFFVCTGSKVLLPGNDEPTQASIIINKTSGKIVEVRQGRHTPEDLGLGAHSVEWLEAGKNVVLPGLVDAHVHLNEPGRTDWEGFWTGTRAAASGGITTLVDMPLNSLPPTTTVPNLEAKRQASLGQCHTDVAFWGGVIPGNQEHLKPLVAAGVRGFKCFLMESGVDEFPRVNDQDLILSMKELEDTGSVLLFHAELEDGDVETNPSNPRDYSTFLSSRPQNLEINAISLVIELQKVYSNLRCHIVHLSAASALPLIRSAKSAGLPLTVETCFHYLCLSAEDIPAGHAEFKCCPPVREASNRDLLWDALKEGLINCVVSDHSPCVLSLKGLEDGDIMSAWGGISTLGLGLSLLWTEGQKRGVSLSQIIGWMSKKTADHAGLGHRKGQLKEGFDGDFVLWDQDAEFEVTKDTLQYKNKISPYEGMKLKGLVNQTYLGGKKIYDRAAISSAIDYKVTMVKNYETAHQETEAYSECHSRSARRVLKALLANGGVFIKMGQHIASLVVLPVEWTSTMKVLQDKCEPTLYEDLETLFLNDMGAPISELFDDFDPEPIGVASLAQVHIGRHKASGQTVAVKLQHPHLAEFCDVDMEMVDATLGWIKCWFPSFEFSWLGEEMRTNLPKEMDFVHEADNASRTTIDFANVRTSLYIPKVVLATKRVLVMEYIQGGRVDDLKYLAAFDIDRNKVAIELSRIFNQMVFVNGWFHADPHPGNLLIRPKVSGSKSPYNFEIVLLDHGLYFDMESKLRVNYSKLWLSLMAPASASTVSDRRKYAELVGNIGADLYPVFEAALTGRVALEGSWDEQDDISFQRASSLIDMVPQTDEEKDAIRNAVMQKEGILLSVFDVLRRIPRRVLMVLKLNDLTRSLDHALMTTHSNVGSHIQTFFQDSKYNT